MSDWTSTETVRAWLTQGHASGGPATPVTDAAALLLSVNAANKLVDRYLTYDEVTIDPNGQLAATMLAARLYRRRMSPEGTIGSLTDGSVAYIARTDPDVAQLLGIGPWMKPAAE